MAVNYGLKVTVVGKGISSAEPRDYVLNSKYSTVKILKEGTGIIAVANEDIEIVWVDHDLGFIPIVLTYCENVPDSGNFYIGSYASAHLDVSLRSGIASGSSLVTSTKVKLVFYNESGGNRTMKYKYFIFADDGA